MEKVQIQWGDLKRTEAIEAEVMNKAKKILNFAPSSTGLHINLRVINPTHSAGVPTQSVQMDLRLPNRQDILAHKESDNLYKAIKEVQKVVLDQVSSKKEQGLI